MPIKANFETGLSDEVDYSDWVLPAIDGDSTRASKLLAGAENDLRKAAEQLIGARLQVHQADVRAAVTEVLEIAANESVLVEFSTVSDDPLVLHVSFALGGPDLHYQYWSFSLEDAIDQLLADADENSNYERARAVRDALGRVTSKIDAVIAKA